MSATERYREARDLLISLRGRHEEALEQFAWPDVGERFNWGVDWFDAIARGNDDAGAGRRRPRTARARRSASTRWPRARTGSGAGCAGSGSAAGDPVLLMLGNQVELWDVMLAVMKLGAVIVPTATAAGAADLADRVARSGARAVVTTPDQTGEVRRAGCRPRAGQRRPGRRAGPTCTTRMPSTSSRCPTPAPRRATRCCSTSPPARPRGPSSSSTPRCRTRSGTSRPPTGSACSPATGTSTSPAPGGPSTRGRASSRRGSRSRRSWCCRTRGSTPACCSTCCASTRSPASARPPTVWRMLINADLSGGPGSLREVVGAGEPLNPEVIEQVRRAWGLDLRDGYGQTEMTAAVGNTPGSPLKPGLDGPAAARGAGGARRPAERVSGSTGRGRASSASTSPRTRCR